MKIKKIIAIVVCAIMACFSLAGCAEGEIGKYLENYDWKPEIVVDLNFDFYIISECGNSEEAENAITTVEAKINQILKDKYDTSINMHYLSADEYVETVLDVANTDAEYSDRHAGDIVLIQSEELYNSLSDKLVDLNPFLTEKEHITDFGTLNTQLTPSILEAAKIDVDGVEKLPLIPNDHVIGNYEYTIIDRAVAEGMLNFSAQSELYEMSIVDGVPNSIAEELIDSVKTNLPDTAVSDVIRVETGMYEDKAKWESEGYICNVSKYPEVTSAVTFASGFGILQSKDFEYDVDGNPETDDSITITAADSHKRAMEVIYAINADSDVRNLLQYGVEHTNYVLRDSETEFYADGTPVKYVEYIEGNVYKMNLLYTGDIFNAYFCKDDVITLNGKSGAWTYEIYNNGTNQNAESFVKE